MLGQHPGKSAISFRLWIGLSPTPSLAGAIAANTKLDTVDTMGDSWADNIETITSFAKLSHEIMPARAFAVLRSSMSKPRGS